MKEYFVKTIQDIVETNPDSGKDFNEIKFEVNISDFRSISLNKLDGTLNKLKNK